MNVEKISHTFQLFIIPRFSCIITECRNAVPVSHGISDAFSTGSHPQYPPQPSTHTPSASPSTDPAGQKQPRHHRPSPRNVDPLLARIPHHQRAQRERKRHRKPHIPQVQHRRMDHHLRILQQRIQPEAILCHRPRLNRKRRRRKVQQHQERRPALPPESSTHMRSAAHPPCASAAAQTRTSPAATPTAAASLPALTTAPKTCTPDSAPGLYGAGCTAPKSRSYTKPRPAQTPLHSRHKAGQPRASGRLAQPVTRRKIACIATPALPPQRTRQTPACRRSKHQRQQQRKSCRTPAWDAWHRASSSSFSQPHTPPFTVCNLQDRTALSAHHQASRPHQRVYDSPADDPAAAASSETSHSFPRTRPPPLPAR